MSGARILPPLAIGVLAFAIRSLHAPAVFLGDRILLGGPDCYYHMRRILFTLVNFPASLGVDPYLAPPAGGRAIWPPLFDVATAWLLRPLWTPGGERTIELAASWLPPVLGALAAAMVVLVGWRIFDRTTGVLAGVLVALAPVHTNYSQVGFVDHHAAVALAAILLIAATARLVTALLDRDAAPRRRFGAAVVCGVALGGIVLLWPGSLIHVAAVVAGLAFFTATRPDRDSAARAARAAALAYTVACLLVAPSGLGASWSHWSDWTPVVLSRFQPWLFAALAAHALACALLWRRVGAAGDVGARLIGSVALGFGVLGLSALLLPGINDGIEDARRWLTMDETFQAMVSESMPLLYVGGRLSAGALRQRVGDLAFVFPLCLVWLAWASRRRPDRDLVALLVIWAALLCSAALLQRRFANSAALPFALITAWAIAETGRRCAARWAQGSPAVATAVSALVLVLGVASVASFHAANVAVLARFLRGEHVVRDPGRVARMVDLGEWLRTNTPETSGFFDADARPEYSVMATWGHGHVIRYVGRRPPVSDNFGDDVSPENFRASGHYFGTHREEDGLAILERFGARYVVVDPINVRLFTQSGARSLSHRLYRFDGAGLGRHRLVHDLAGELPGQPPETVPYKIFEPVAGARLRGRAAPGERITATLTFTTNRGREGELEWSTQAGADGAWELVVPHATASPGDVRTGPSYRLAAASGTARVRVPESAVLEGGVLEAPPLRAATEEDRT